MQRNQKPARKNHDDNRAQRQAASARRRELNRVRERESGWDNR